MHIDEKNFGDTIRRLRIRKKLPLEEVAARANLSPISVMSLELGRGSTLSTMIHVLKAIDETGFIMDWIAKSTESSPLQVLRNAKKMTSEPKRAPKKTT